MLSGLHPPASQKLKGIIEKKQHQFEVLYSITNTSSPKNITKEKKKTMETHPQVSQIVI